MKLTILNQTITIIFIYLCFSSNLIVISSALTKSKRVKKDNPKNVKSLNISWKGFPYLPLKIEEEKCFPRKPIEFLIGLLYGPLVLELNKKFEFDSMKKIEQCVDASLQTVINVIEHYTRSSKKKAEAKEPGTISKCFGNICSLAGTGAKIGAQTTVAGITALGGGTHYLFYNLTGQSKKISLDKIKRVVKKNYEKTGTVIDNLTGYWNEKIAPYVNFVIDFIGIFMTKNTIKNIESCFITKEQKMLFYKRIGEKLLDYMQDGDIKDIAEKVLPTKENLAGKVMDIYNNELTSAGVDAITNLVPGLTGSTEKLNQTKRKGFFGNLIKSAITITSVMSGPLVSVLKKKIKSLSPEIAWCIKGLFDNINEYLNETDECKKPRIIGKIIYKVVRIGKVVYDCYDLSCLAKIKEKAAESVNASVDLQMDNPMLWNGNGI